MTFRITNLIAFSVFALISFHLLGGCKDNPIEPPIKNPRTYTWTIDTLAYPGSFQTAMRDIWGSSPSDVYVVGHNDGPGDGTMYRFDGKSWKTTGFHISGGGNVAGPVSLSAIFGFSGNNIYAVGRRIYDNPKPPPNFLDSSLILHFDGRQWREQKVSGGRALWSISASAPNDIWTCGTDGTLYHFNGNMWQRDSVSTTVPPDGTFGLWDIKAKSSSESYMIGIVHQNSLVQTTFYFFIRQQKQWSVADSFIVQPGQYEAKFGINGLWVSPKGTLYSFGPHIFRWTGSSWIKVYETFDALRKMAGTSEKNMFAVGDFGKILHYNGNDWHEFKELRNPNAVYSSVWTDGREVFVVGYLNDGSKTLILHGR
jgi:hypothetical protein